MAYWWVSQDKTYQHEREGQYPLGPLQLLQVKITIRDLLKLYNSYND